MEGEGRRGEDGIKLKKKNCIKLRGEKKKKEGKGEYQWKDQ